MLKKLSQFFYSFLGYLLDPKKYQKKWEDKLDADFEKSIKELAPSPVINSPEMAKSAVPAKEYVSMNLETGKIVFPDSMSEEDKKEIEAALNELNQSLQKLAPEDMFASLEDFINKGGEVPNSDDLPIWDGLTAVNNDVDGLAKVEEEAQFCEEQTEHWNDIDFAEALNEFLAQGYEFEGVDYIFGKINEKLDLTKEEKDKLRDWYKLATQGFVYEV